MVLGSGACQQRGWVRWHARIATLDVHAADQFLPYMALAKGESVFRARELSGHAKTNMSLIEKFLDVKFEVTEKEGLEEVRVKGVG
jgi:RNA 3'-terminal phosphate cyclase